MGLLLPSILVMTISLGLVGRLGASANAQSAQPAFACSNATLSGAYGVAGAGFLLGAPDGSPLDSPQPTAVVVLATADAAGNVTLVQQSGARATLQGTYSVNSNCSVEFTVISPAGTEQRWVGVLVNGGNKAFVTWGDATPISAYYIWERV